MEIRAAKLTAAALSVMLLASCGTGAEDDGHNSGPPPELEFDPPRRFDPDGSYDLDTRGLTPTEEGTAYAYVHGDWWDDTLLGVNEVDLSTGEPNWSKSFVLFDEEAEDESSLSLSTSLPRAVEGSPKVGDVDGERLVFAVYPYAVPGSGTMPESAEVHAVALAASDGSVVWDRSLAAEDRSVGMRVLAADGERVLVSADLADHGIRGDMSPAGGSVFVLDARTGEEIWSSSDLDSVHLEGDVLVGTRRAADTEGLDDHEDYFQRVGLDADTGDQLWESDPHRRSASQAVPPDSPLRGAGLVRVTGEFWETDDTRTQILAASTGEVVFESSGSLYCRYDTEATLVCGRGENPRDGETDEVFALDTESFEELWAISEEGDRIVPEVRAVYKGTVYAEAGGGPLLIDARTGEDDSTELTVAPDRVTAGFGFDETWAHQVTVHPAAG